MFLFKDDVRYNLWKPQKESELEQIVVEHYKEIFGEDSIYFDIKQVIKSKAGILSIPDGYIVYTSKPYKWSIVEVELSSHPVFEHIVPQITKFINGIKSQDTRHDIIQTLYGSVKKDLFSEVFIRKRIESSEIYMFLSNVVSTKPNLVVVIEEKIKQLEEAIENLPLKTDILEVRTFKREDAETVHIHSFSGLEKIPPPVGGGKGKAKGYTGKSISAFYFKGTRYEVRYWKDLLMKLTDVICESHAHDFGKVSKITGEKRLYFSQDKNKLKKPQKISKANIFVETNLSANSIVKICQRLLDTFDYSSEDLKIDVG